MTVHREGLRPRHVRLSTGDIVSRDGGMWVWTPPTEDRAPLVVHNIFAPLSESHTGEDFEKLVRFKMNNLGRRP